MCGIHRFICGLLLAIHGVFCIEYAEWKGAPFRVSGRDELPGGDPVEFDWRNQENRGDVKFSQDGDPKGAPLDPVQPGPRFDCGEKGFTVVLKPGDFVNIKIYEHISLSCPVKKSFPAVGCKNDGMELTIGDLTPEDLSVLFNGELAPLLYVASQCWRRKRSNMEGLSFWVPYSTCGVNFRDGSFVLDLSYKDEAIPLQCPSDSVVPDNGGIPEGFQQLAQNKPSVPQSRFPSKVMVAQFTEPSDPVSLQPKDVSSTPAPTPKPMPHWLSKRPSFPGLFNVSVNFPFSVPIPANPVPKEPFSNKGRDHTSVVRDQLPKRPLPPGLFNLSVNFPFAVPVPARPISIKDRFRGYLSKGMEQDQVSAEPNQQSKDSEKVLPEEGLVSGTDPLSNTGSPGKPSSGGEDPLSEGRGPETLSGRRGYFIGGIGKQFPVRYPLSGVQYPFSRNQEPGQLMPVGSDPLFGVKDLAQLSPGSRDLLFGGGDKLLPGRKNPISVAQYPFSRDGDSDSFPSNIKSPLSEGRDQDQLSSPGVSSLFVGKDKLLTGGRHPWSDDRNPLFVGRFPDQLLPIGGDPFSGARNPDQLLPVAGDPLSGEKYTDIPFPLLRKPLYGRGSFFGRDTPLVARKYVLSGSIDPLPGMGSESSNQFSQRGGQLFGRDPLSISGDQLSGNTDQGGRETPVSGSSDSLYGRDPFTRRDNPFTGNSDPLSGSEDSLSGGDGSFSGSSDQLPGNDDYLYGKRDPFAGSSSPFSRRENVFYGRDPVYGSGDPLSEKGVYGSSDPFSGRDRSLPGSVNPLSGRDGSVSGRGDPFYGSNNPVPGSGLSSGKYPWYGGKDPAQIFSGSTDPSSGSKQPFFGRDSDQLPSVSKEDPTSRDTDQLLGTMDGATNTASLGQPLGVKTEDESWAPYQSPTAKPLSDRFASQSQYQPGLPFPLQNGDVRFGGLYMGNPGFSYDGARYPRSQALVRSIKGTAFTGSEPVTPSAQPVPLEDGSAP
ncbi:hypothetical protein DNTS_007717 [Danionella cerebrum]|uniref:ZP domain-containing protein n=1 Tax=Danionella cerebrum TaxID=2873325 RepID=A0A553QSC4_9TELE|nr:hypothetical protein DNTS_007717 [Danionella translucida]